MSEAPTTIIEDAPVTPPPAPPMTNSPEARTETGEIKHQDSPTPTPTSTTTAKEAAPEAPKETSLLTEKSETALTGAPEKYESFKAPEGYEFKQDTMDGAHTLFKELNLSQAGAQRLVDFHSAELKAAMEAPRQEWEAVNARWREEVKNSPDLGGKLDQVKVSVSRMIDSLGTQLANDFRREMNLYGMGNNPTFIRALYQVSQKLSEGTNVPGGNLVHVNSKGERIGTGPRSAAEVLYPNLNRS